MKFTLPLAAAALAFAIPAIGAEANQPATDTQVEDREKTEEAAPEENKQEDAAPAIEVPEVTPVEEEKRICRRIRTDMSSRRATRVCMTRSEWREFNSGG